MRKLTIIFLVKLLCQKITEIKKDKKETYESLITYVKDRLGHDYRYAIDCTKIENELGWKNEISFDVGILKTIEWYMEF